MQTSTDKKSQEVTISLLAHYCENNPKGLEIADGLQTILMIAEQNMAECSNNTSYIGSEDFIKTKALMNALKVKLIIQITIL